MDPVRSSAKERRLRQKRSDARVRLRLAADAALLSEHHASAVPQTQKVAASALHGDRVVALLEQLAAQQGALCGMVASMNGWLAGMALPSGCGADWADGGSFAGGAVVHPFSPRQADDIRVPEAHAGYTSHTQVDRVDAQAGVFVDASQTAVRACVPCDAGGGAAVSSVSLGSFCFADVVGGADPEVFARSQQYFGSAEAHRDAFDDVARTLTCSLAEPPCDTWVKDAVVDSKTCGEMVSDPLAPFRVIPGVHDRLQAVVAGGFEDIPDCRTNEDLLALLLQEPGGVILSGLSLGSLYQVALFIFAGFPRPYNLESYVDLLRLVPGGLQSSSFLPGR